MSRTRVGPAPHRVIARRALVGTLRLGVGGDEQVHPDVGLRQIVASGQSRLEQERRASRLRHDLARHHDSHVARAVEHVHALVRIARVHVDLVVLLEPGVHLRPLERHVVAQEEPARRRIGIAPRGMLRGPVAHPHRPARGSVRAAAGPGMAGRREGLAPDVRAREVVDRDAARLPEQEGAPAVGDELAREAHPHPAGARLELVTGIRLGGIGGGHHDLTRDDSTGPSEASRGPTPSRAATTFRAVNSDMTIPLSFRASGPWIAECAQHTRDGSAAGRRGVEAGRP